MSVGNHGQIAIFNSSPVQRKPGCLLRLLARGNNDIFHVYRVRLQ